MNSYKWFLAGTFAGITAMALQEGVGFWWMVGFLTLSFGAAVVFAND